MEELTDITITIFGTEEEPEQRFDATLTSGQMVQLRQDIDERRTIVLTDPDSLITLMIPYSTYSGKYIFVNTKDK